MFGSCGICCCWCCGDGLDYHRARVLRESRHAANRPSSTTPVSRAGTSSQPTSLASSTPNSRQSCYPPPPAMMHEKSYGTYDEMRPYLRSPVLQKRSENGTADFHYDNPACGVEVQQVVSEEEVFYQTHHADELVKMESRRSKLVVDTKRISIQPTALYNKFSTATASRNVNWSLRQQPFFDKLSSSSRMSSRLVDDFALDESFDSSTEIWDRASSAESGDTVEEVITRPPSAAHFGPSRGDLVPPSRMSGYHASPGLHGSYYTLRTLSRNEGFALPDVSSITTDAYTLQQLKDEMADVTAEMETLEGGEDGKNNPKSKQMSIGRKKFNMDPKKGIEYLIEHGLLKNTPDDISKFLYNGEGLNKTAIGDYLGERHDFNQTVLYAFVALHDFTDLILVQALRQFLWSFRLPGEAQKIDRMMERFAGHYCELNPSIFQHPDTCFVLSFAIIMLNTSLHNPAVKDKQTLEQFINMNRGIDNGDDLPRELLESLYESIKTEPFKIPEDDGNDLMHTFFNPDREGWLWKQGGRYKSWKRRWFILNDNCLYYFEYTTDKEPRGIIPLENIEVREVHDRNKPHCFELYATSTDFIKACKTDSEGKVVEGKHTVYRMSAATHEEKEEWIKCIRQSISHNPFYDLLAKRKKNIQKNSS